MRLEIENIDVTEFTELFRGIIRAEFAAIVKELNPTDQSDLMSRKEVMDFLKISPSTLWKHTKAGKLNSSGLGNRVYYQRSEVVAAVKSLNT